MAIYHNTVGSVCPKQGQSIVASSSYITGEKRVDERTGIIHDYTRKGGVVFHEVLLCDNAPQQYKDPAFLWNEVGKVEGGVGRTGKSIEMALPRELSREEQIQFAREAVKDFYVRDGRCVEYAIHDKGDGNPHIHAIATTRPIDENEQWEYKTEKIYICKNHEGRIKELSARELKSERGNGFEKQLPFYKNGNPKSNAVYLTKYEQEHNERWKDYKRVKGKNDPKKTACDRENPTCAKWNSEQNLTQWRAFWGERINRELEIKNLPQRVDHRSYEAQGVDKIATKHMGKSAMQMERKGKKSKRGNLNREIVWLNEDIRKTQTEFNIIKGRIEQDNRWNQFHEANAMLLKSVCEHSSEEMLQLGSLKKLAKIEEGVNTYLREPDLHKDDHYTINDKDTVGYRQYHAEKVREDIASIRSAIEKNLTGINREAQGQTHVNQAGLQSAAPNKTAFDVAFVARRLEQYRTEFIKVTMEAEKPTAYQENPIYRQQAAQITNSARIIKEQTASIEKLKAARDKLGLFQSREKKELQGKIKNFEHLRAEQLDRLKVLGVSDPSCADEVVKEKNFLAEQEKAKLRAAHDGVGEANGANVIKTAFHSLAQTVPNDVRRAVLNEMKKVREHVEKGMDAYNVEITAQRELDIALKPRGTQEQEKTITRERND